MKWLVGNRWYAVLSLAYRIESFADRSNSIIASNSYFCLGQNTLTPAIVIKKRTFYIMAFVTLFGFSALGFFLIECLQKLPFLSVFEHGLAWYYQLLLGLGYGILTAMIAWEIIKSKLLTPVRELYGGIIRQLNLKVYEVVFISFCAGVGEEVLFRAAIQPLLGLWITSVLFVAIHGYLHPTNWRLSIYGVYMTLVIAGVGYMFSACGLVAAISAHFIIDVILLSVLRK